MTHENARTFAARTKKTVTLTADQWESLHHWAFEGLDYHSYWPSELCPGDPESGADLSASMQKGWESLEQLREQIDRLELVQ